MSKKVQIYLNSVKWFQGKVTAIFLAWVALLQAKGPFFNADIPLCEKTFNQKLIQRQSLAENQKECISTFIKIYLYRLWKRYILEIKHYSVCSLDFQPNKTHD